MTTPTQQLRCLLDGYVYDRETSAEIRCRTATYARMLSLARQHGLSVGGLGGRVTVSDGTYTYAVVDGEPQAISG